PRGDLQEHGPETNAPRARGDCRTPQGDHRFRTPRGRPHVPLEGRREDRRDARARSRAATVAQPRAGSATRLRMAVDRRIDRMTYTHGHHESVLRSHTWRTVENSAAYLAPRLVPNTSVLDVGCGPGNITADIAARVEPGRVIGIDASEEIVAQA